MTRYHTKIKFLRQVKSNHREHREKKKTAEGAEIAE